MKVHLLNFTSEKEKKNNMDHIICAICLLIGYFFGCFQTAYFLGKLRNVDIRKKGSGNLGTTNMFRVMGAKAGLITFLGDIAKVFIAVGIVYLIFKTGFRTEIPRITLFLYTGFGAVLGHDFPFYLGFKGGKGVAATAAAWLTIWDWRLIIIGVAVFFAVVFATKYVSLASLCLAGVFFIVFTIFSFIGIVGPDGIWRVENIIIVFLMSALIFYKHRTNITRLLKGEENKFEIKKTDKRRNDS